MGSSNILTRLNEDRLLQILDECHASEQESSPRLKIIEEAIERIKSDPSNSLSAAVNAIESLALEEKGQIFYFGGFIRDLYLGRNPRDIDMVFTDEEHFMERFRDKVKRKTRFGGYKLVIEGADVDAWAVDNTYYFVQTKEATPCVHRLPFTTFFNAEAVVLEAYPKHRWGWENGFFDACERKVLDINNYLNALDPGNHALNLVRTLSFQKKLEWQIGPELKRYLSNQLNITTPQELEEVSLSHYGHKTDGELIRSELIRLAD